MSGWNPQCCNAAMVHGDFGFIWLCLTCRRSRIVSIAEEGREIMASMDVMRRTSWKPTVPHPLLQIDEELKAYGAADE